MFKLHLHTLDAQIDEQFLAQEREDPITGEFLEAGDEVVICAGCQSAFLADSWEYLGKKHCQQHRTLPALPQPESLTLKHNPKRFVIGEYVQERAEAWRRIVAFVIDVAVGLLASVFIFLPMLGIYFWLRDSLGRGISIGKSWMGLQTLDAETGTPCTWQLSFRRNFLWGLTFSYGHLLLYAVLIGGEMLASFIGVTGLIVLLLTFFYTVLRFILLFTPQESNTMFKTRVVRLS